MRLIAGIIAALALAAPAAAEPPKPCQPDAEGGMDFEACAKAAAPGSAERMLAYINLGTHAFLRGDYAAAVRFYDEARPADRTQRLYSDATFHAFRAAAYERVGREPEALEDAQVALAMLEGKSPPGVPDRSADAEPEAVLPYVLPILKRGGDAGYPRALAVYRSMPAKDWVSYANRAGVLAEVGEVQAALADNAQAAKLAPDEPAVLNNSCYILTLAGRPGEGLPSCQRAAAAAPQVPAVHDSYAVALAALGRCSEAQAELAKARTLDPASLEYSRKLACTKR
ncbi:tetratricopeptide repeat protein [Phenylobacterium sp.]|jgi:tetratricopeptide (TPR) repeat protein|uniref:tetratricopeptide repeat protein n=1 Tax=Phenylobacterium sp. TaxID=1871053 RepID=UPI002F940362